MKTEQIEINGKLAVYHIGQNAADNFAAIDKSESAQDIWFHAEESSSCHVVFIHSDKIWSKDEIRKIVKKGALLCKQHTAKLKSEKKVNIIYATMENLTKCAQVGQVEVVNAKTIMV